ncbi:TPA: hypothetical protein DEB00_01105 [Candidatus Uhrbacteria bacterium]|nr:hypothetical protein [Candidatus Uhrbacteria bacterium]
MAGESEQFVIPQFIDVESKIIGPVTVRQFTLIMASGLVGAVIYKLFDFSLFLLLVIPLGIVTLLFAFVKINGQGLHYVALNWVQTLRRPSLRVWNKNKSDAELRAKIFKKELPPPPPSYTKPSLHGSRLRDLSLVVNTGGVFVPDDEKIT